MIDLPKYAALPPAEFGGRSGWGLFGAEDNLGMLNLQTPERVVAAAGLIRTGRVFPLNAPIGAFLPSYAPHRGVPERRTFHAEGALSFDDVYDQVFPQASSQWDGLGHFGYVPGMFYNGASESDVWTGRRNTIEHWARRGIAGRMVVLDMPRLFAATGREYTMDTRLAFTVDDLEAAKARAGVQFQGGDVLLVHTGFAAWFLGLPEAERRRLVEAQVAPGLAAGEAMCAYLWDAELCAVVSDAVAVEALPRLGDGPTDFLHRILIGQFGMALGELWWTEELAADCAADGVYEVFLASAPMHSPGGFASPANALAIK